VGNEGEEGRREKEGAPTSYEVISPSVIPSAPNTPEAGGKRFTRKKEEGKRKGNTAGRAGNIAQNFFRPQ